MSHVTQPILDLTQTVANLCDEVKQLKLASPSGVPHSESDVHATQRSVSPYPSGNNDDRQSRSQFRDSRRDRYSPSDSKDRYSRDRYSRDRYSSGSTSRDRYSHGRDGFSRGNHSSRANYQYRRSPSNSRRFPSSHSHQQQYRAAITCYYCHIPGHKWNQCIAYRNMLSSGVNPAYFPLRPSAPGPRGPYSSMTMQANQSPNQGYHSVRGSAQQTYPFQSQPPRHYNANEDFQ